MDLSTCGAQFIAEFEGYSGTAYWDGFGKVWTIGFGTTDPAHAYQGATCTREQALGWLREEADGRDSPGINRLGLDLTQQQHDALVSFSYNLGPGVIGNANSSIGAALRQHRYADVPGALMQYTHAGGQELPGLVRRRQREGQLFAHAEYGFPCVPNQPPENDMPLSQDDLKAIAWINAVATDGQLDQHGLGKGEPDPAWMVKLADMIVARLKK